MLISEGSMASSNISGDIVAGVFDKKQTTSMYWSNSYPTENNNLSEMKYYYHQCQNSSGADMIAKRKEAREAKNWEVADKIRILYGGSVKPDNIHAYLSMEDIDGALVGGASLKLDSYNELINNI